MTFKELNPNELCDIITDGIYKTCKANRKKKENKTSEISFNNNCTSKNFKSIAEANLQRAVTIRLCFSKFSLFLQNRVKTKFFVFSDAFNSPRTEYQ